MIAEGMTNEETIEITLHKEKYQVFLCMCRCTFPLSFAAHPWFVVNKRGVVSRYAVNHRKNKGEKKWGHVALNANPPFHGLPFFLYPKVGRFKTTVLKSVAGNEDSLAARMAAFIENSPHTYEHAQAYSFTGPNSNTYIQWVLNHFPDFEAQLPWNAFGKGFGFGGQR